MNATVVSDCLVDFDEAALGQQWDTTLSFRWNKSEFDIGWNQFGLCYNHISTQHANRKTGPRSHFVVTKSSQYKAYCTKDSAIGHGRNNYDWEWSSWDIILR